eukprot:206772-Heterocapsa_arctica.AAC.1
MARPIVNELIGVLARTNGVDGSAFTMIVPMLTPTAQGLQQPRHVGANLPGFTQRPTISRRHAVRTAVEVALKRH